MNALSDHFNRLLEATRTSTIMKIKLKKMMSQTDFETSVCCKKSFFFNAVVMNLPINLYDIIEIEDMQFIKMRRIYQ